MWLKRKSSQSMEKKARPRWQLRWRAIQVKALPLLSILLLVVVIIVPLVLFSWFLFGTDMFQVQAITVIDGTEETNAQTKEIIRSRIDKITLASNIFFVQTDSLEEEILSKLPQIRTIHIVRKLPGTIKAIVQEKQPVMLLQSAGKYYFVDQAGITYQEARIANLPGVILPTVKNNDQAAAVTLGVAAVTPDFVTFVQSIEDTWPIALSAKPATMYIPSLAAREVHIKLDNNWLILFDATRSAITQITVIQKLLSTIVTPDEANQLEYIDTRIPNRVYYKTRVISNQ